MHNKPACTPEFGNSRPIKAIQPVAVTRAKIINQLETLNHFKPEIKQ